MGKKLDALFGRNFKTSKFKPLVNLAISRLAILKNQRQSRCSLARTDIVQLLNLGQHDRALLRVDQVIKEQNLLDVFVMIEGYCLLVIERVNLIEQEKVCPDELKEAISSLLYASTRCGEFPELQEMRAVFTSRFGKEFAARSIELRNNCGVNPKIIQKLSTRQPSLEDRLKVLKEIASENGIVLQIDEPSSEFIKEKLDFDQKQKLPKPEASVNPGGAELGNNLQISPDEIGKVETFCDTPIARKKYRDVADAAQAAFESAAYAAAAARAAVELSRSESHDPDDQNSPGPRRKRGPDAHEPMKSEVQTGEGKGSRGIEDPRVGLGFEKIHPIQNYQSESEDEKTYNEIKIEEYKQKENVAEFKRSMSASSSDTESILILKGPTMSSDVVGKTRPLGTDIVFDESDDETGNEQSQIPLKPSVFTNAGLSYGKSYTVWDEDVSEASGEKLYHPSHKQFPLKPQAGFEVESNTGNPKAHFSEGSKINSAQHLNTQNGPISVRTRRGR
ncbi:hypothetical protein F0562_032757 [Nyssa sinensis]|uniref:IST1-like protein n=1 Tax=Nyssa sinensis TaxID=561372 RepID=A0A5J5AQV5_9ASTE|nr:hypothetical protein F0562_032757 [Nyssa sinensis]